MTKSQKNITRARVNMLVEKMTPLKGAARLRRTVATREQKKSLKIQSDYYGLATREEVIWF
jgi:hypothetical protein